MNSTGVKIISIVLLLSVFPARGQNGFADRYLMRTIDLEQGLPCSFVDDMYLDAAGFLWIATSGGGLCRHDGYEMLTFSTSSTPALRSNFIRAIVEDRFNRMWIASEGGLDILDLPTHEKVDLGLGFNKEPRLCSFVTMDAEGAVWTKFEDTLYRIEFGSGGEVSGVLPFSHPGLADANHVFEDVDQDGTVWTRLEDGIYKIGVSSRGVLEAGRVAVSLSLGPDTYVSDFLVADSCVWIATQDGLYRVYRGTGEWKQYRNSPSDPRSLTQNFVSGLAMTADGLLLACTLHGLNVYNPVSDNFERVGAGIINGIKTAGDYLLIGTENRGLCIAEPKSLFVQNVSNEPGRPLSLSAGAVNALWQEPDGRLWVGVVEGGLNIGNPGTVEFMHLTRERDGLSHNSISALRPGPDGVMYAGTWGGGVDVLSAGTKPKVLRHLPDAGGRMDFVGVLEYDSVNGLLWIGSNRGVFTFDPASGRYSAATEEAVSGCIGSCIDRENRLWIGCQEGLLMFDLGKRKEDGGFEYIHYRYVLDDPGSGLSEKICCVLEASSGELYVGSNGGGFYRASSLEGGKYSFVNYSSRDGLSSDRVRGFCEDDFGRIWISTEYGLNLFNPGTGVITPFYERDGLKNMRFHWNNALMGTDGLLYFGHAQGYSAVNPQEMSVAMPKNDNMRFTKVVKGREIYRNPFLSELRMHEKDRSILFQFAVLTPDAESTVRYRYQLEGYDDQLISLPPGRREVSYSSLPAGRYRFRVEAFDRYGFMTDSVAVSVRVEPYCYHTAWFAALMAFLLLLLVILIIRIRTRQLKRRQEVLEETVEQRTREISAQKRLVEEKADELKRQNEVLLHQNEELASRKMLAVRREDPFKEKALETLRGMYRNPDLDVNAFCLAMGMSKTLLNTRLQEAFGQSIGQFIRTYRLTLAREMLESGSGLTVAEVAYDVGFNDPKYFTRCFTKEFSASPSSVGKS